MGIPTFPAARLWEPRCNTLYKAGGTRRENLVPSSGLLPFYISLKSSSISFPKFLNPGSGVKSPPQLTKVS